MIFSFAADLLDHPKVVETKLHTHHSISKHDHLTRTARISYRLARFIGADVRTCVRAAVIHDIDSRLGTIRTHGSIAARWAEAQGECKEVCHAIETHMYPFGPKPQTREAWVVSLADKAATFTDLTLMLGGLVTGRTFIRRRQFRQSDPYMQLRLQRRRRRRLRAFQTFGNMLIIQEASTKRGIVLLAGVDKAAVPFVQSMYNSDEQEE